MTIKEKQTATLSDDGRRGEQEEFIEVGNVQPNQGSSEQDMRSQIQGLEVEFRVCELSPSMITCSWSVYMNMYISTCIQANAEEGLESYKRLYQESEVFIIVDVLLIGYLNFL